MAPADVLALLAVSALTVWAVAIVALALFGGDTPEPVACSACGWQGPAADLTETGKCPRCGTAQPFP